MASNGRRGHYGDWGVSRFCEEFSCTPLVAVRELRRAPDLIGRVIEARSVGHWFHRIDRAKDGDEFPTPGQDAMFDLVAALIEEIELAKLARAKARQAERQAARR